ncbi:MAG: hypothetical protein FWH06_03675, partial [Oscillospiraceae bacterium]|nr:hypothetical protein [Oscillospiraceae bacterium]
MKKSLLAFIGMLIAIFLLALVDIYGVDLVVFEVPSFRDGIRLGLDLSGGSSITYEAVIPEGMSQSEVDSGLLSAEAMLRARLDQFGYTEALLSRAGSNRLTVDIPNIQNPEEAVALLGSTARLEFRDADGGIIIYGSQVISAKSTVGPIEQNGPSVPHVVLELSDDAREAFREATKEAASRPVGENYIGIYLDEAERSRPTVDSRYTTTGIDPKDGVTITVGGDAKAAKDL